MNVWESNIDSGAPLLSVRDLKVDIAVEGGVIHAVQGVSWQVRPGEVLGIVGESGSGKSVSVKALLGLVPTPPATVTGSVVFNDRDLLQMSDRELEKIRGQEIAMIFQDPMTAFNPVMTVGDQIAEAIRVHETSVSRKAARARAIDLLHMVDVPSPATRYGQFPHEFSGGMRQRAMIAMAMANRPRIIVADEPTTALDVTIQAQVIEMLRVAQRETECAILFITHDLGLVAELADRVLVMYGGKVVETTDVFSLFSHPKHPYTLGLLSSVPRLDIELQQLLSIPGEPPSLLRVSESCMFQPRCFLSRGRAACAHTPPLRAVESGDHLAACHFSEEMESAAETISTELGADARATGEKR